MTTHLLDSESAVHLLKRFIRPVVEVLNMWEEINATIKHNTNINSTMVHTDIFAMNARYYNRIKQNNTRFAIAKPISVYI